MKLLLTNDELHEVRGGTQVFISDLALALRGRGHEVAVYSWLRGSLADDLQKENVPVVAAPCDCAFIPDVIHGQHHLAAMTALCAFPDAPAIYHCHGYTPWQERPPVHPRILRYVSVAPAFSHWIAGITKRDAAQVSVVPSGISLCRFHEVRRPGLHPRRAALFGNGVIPPEHLSKLRRACARCGLTLDLIGAPFATGITQPEKVLPSYDLVFAVGRSALEAMASGCAVLPFDAHGCAPIVTPGSFAAMTGLNFTVPQPGRPLQEEELITRIKAFDPGPSAAVTAIVRETMSFDRSVDQLEKLYSETLDAWRDSPYPSREDESSAMNAYLATLGPHVKGADDRFTALRQAREKSKLRIARLKQKISSLEARLEILGKRMPGVIRRWLLREP